ncbi:MAG: ABC transporter ATP-binding protein [Acidobacteria bacterium]|nr:ABC transporter ATP-binding protein [Acidobacteriota bacterium]MCB9396320.1 ABC transporter ATP-binding protein [Acidobacteriota bacterium]
MNAIQYEGVYKRYPNFTLESLDFTVQEGQITGLIGPNGAGKSTLIRIAMGLVRPDAGKVHVLGHHMPDAQVLAKQEIGYVSEDLRLYGNATLQWHMDFISSIYSGWDAQRAQDLMKRFDIKAEQNLKGFSHGQRVKASILLVLARRPKLLIFDEPTTGLDPIARHEVVSEMMEVLLQEDRTILFSSQNTQDVEQVADRIGFIDSGHLLADEEKDTYLERWRRVHVTFPSEPHQIDFPNLVSASGSGRLRTLIFNPFSEELLSLLRDRVSVTQVETLSLEEIFRAEVTRFRQGVLV